MGTEVRASCADYSTAVALRCFPELQGVEAQHAADGETSARPQRRRRGDRAGRATWIGERLLIFDTETTTDQYQSLRFGFFLRMVRGEEAALGVFLADELEEADPRGADLIREYARKEELLCVSRSEFVEKWLYREAFGIGALVVGFNLPFDLARVALHAGISRGRHRDAFCFRLSEFPSYPCIRIKPIAMHAAVIQFLRPRSNGRKRGARRTFQGRFLDLHTLSHALSGKSYSLTTAGEAFGANVLKAPLGAEHGGPITAEYLDYARQDVFATFSLYLRLRDVCKVLPFYSVDSEWHRDPRDTPIHELYSPASVAKAYYRKIGVTPLLAKQPDFPREYLGYAMAAYFGGRIETRIRKASMPAALMDFSSQYPAVFTLLRLWPQVITARLSIEDDTERATELLSRLAREPGLLYSPGIWPQLAGYAEVLPDDDVLPARVPWGHAQSNVSLTVSPITSPVPLWYALPDLAASTIATGRAPRILRAFRAVSSGAQKGLRRIRIGEQLLTASDPLFFAKVVTERKRLEKQGLSARAAGAKVLASAGCYGVFVEFDPERFESARRDPEDSDPTKGGLSGERVRRRGRLYSDRSFEHTFRGQWEKPGRYCNPLVGSLVTAGGRLLLMMLQREVETLGGSFVWTATDAMAIVRQDPDLPTGACGLSEEQLAAVRERFQQLSPFDTESVPEFLKVEATGTAYAIASSRYAFTVRDGGVKASYHGMGGIIPPNGDRLPEFGKRLWRAVQCGEFDTAWERLPLIRSYGIRKPSIWQQAQKAAPRCSYQKSIKPFGFLRAVSAAKSIGEKERMLLGPYRRDGTLSQRREWWDASTGEQFCVSIRPATESAPGYGQAYCQTVSDFATAFGLHTDRKMEQGGKETKPYASGALQPRRLRVVSVYHIGKETDRLDIDASESARIGEAPIDVFDKSADSPAPAPLLASCVARLSSFPHSEIARLIGVSGRQWQRIRLGTSAPSGPTEKRILGLDRQLDGLEERIIQEKTAALSRIVPQEDSQ